MQLEARTSSSPFSTRSRCIAAAEKGDTVFQADLYDGSEKGQKVYATTAYIGRMHAAGYNKRLPAAKSAERLDGLKAWPVSISYFEPGSDKQDAVPSYELAFLYFENGVSRRLYIDYGEFAIRGSLKEIAFLEPGKCAGRKKPARYSTLATWQSICRRLSCWQAEAAVCGSKPEKRAR